MRYGHGRGGLTCWPLIFQGTHDSCGEKNKLHLKPGNSFHITLPVYVCVFVRIKTGYKNKSSLC